MAPAGDADPLYNSDLDEEEGRLRAKKLQQLALSEHRLSAPDTAEDSDPAATATATATATTPTPTTSPVHRLTSEIVVDSSENRPGDK